MGSNEKVYIIKQTEEYTTYQMLYIGWGSIAFIGLSVGAFISVVGAIVWYVIFTTLMYLEVSRYERIVLFPLIDIKFGADEWDTKFNIEYKKWFMSLFYMGSLWVFPAFGLAAIWNPSTSLSDIMPLLVISLIGFIGVVWISGTLMGIGAFQIAAGVNPKISEYRKMAWIKSKQYGLGITGVYVYALHLIHGK